MSAYYLSYDIERLKEQRQGSYVILDHFKKTVRLELKWVYISLLNQLVDTPNYNTQGEAYLIEDLAKMSDKLAELTNKKVDVVKFQNYMQELAAEDLIDIQEKHYYLKRII